MYFEIELLGINLMDNSWMKLGSVASVCINKIKHLASSPFH